MYISPEDQAEMPSDRQLAKLQPLTEGLIDALTVKAQADNGIGDVDAEQAAAAAVTAEADLGKMFGSNTDDFDDWFCTAELFARHRLALDAARIDGDDDETASRSRCVAAVGERLMVSDEFVARHQNATLIS